MINKILVSACLMGFRVRYNGSEKAKAMAQLSRWQAEQRLVIHCPELAAGLPVPRPQQRFCRPTVGMSCTGRPESLRIRARMSQSTISLPPGWRYVPHRSMAVALRCSRMAAQPAGASISTMVLLPACATRGWVSRQHYSLNMGSRYSQKRSFRR